MDLYSRDNISDAYLCTRVVDCEILDIVLLVTKSPLVNFIDISDNSNYMGSFEGDYDGWSGPQYDDNF